MPLAQYKVLGQVNPASGVQTLLYNTPHYYSTKVSSLVICNYSNSAARFNVIAANTTGAQFHINSNTLISGNDTMIIDNIGLDDNSNVYVTPVNSSSLSFSLFGKEQVKPYEAVTVQYLIIGGGGAGGRQQNYQGTGGGGGAGGLTYGSFSMRKTTDNVLAITVGAGGAGSDASGNGNNGSNTIISQGSLTRSIAYGGGGGGLGDNQYGGAASIHRGNNGGSGGGGSGSDGTFNGQGGSAIQPSSIYGGLGNSGGGVTFPGGGSRTGGYGGGAGGGYTGTLGSRAYGNGISLTTALASFPTTTYSGNFAQGGADGGGAENSDTAGAANTGNGGDGGNTFNGGAVSGGSGTAFLWWTQEYPFVELPVITGSYTYIRQNGYSIYRFTDSGSIRF